MSKRSERKKPKKESGTPIEDVVEPHRNSRNSVPLSKAFPHIAVEWYYKKNCGFGPEDFSYGSKVIAWWQCPVNKDHVYEMRILHRTNRQNGCPFCSGRRVSKETSLPYLFPEIAREWHQSRNGSQSPEDFTSGSFKKVWWQCSRNSKHVWRTSISHRTRGSGCPHCWDKRCLDLRDFPKMLKLFDREMNVGVNPYKLTTDTKVWWRCPVGPDHSWCKPFTKHGERLICPFCKHRLPSITNNLADHYPEVAKELHPTKNGKLAAKNIPSKTCKRLTWRCSVNPRHIWQTSVRNRTVARSGCPECWERKRSNGYFKKLRAQKEERIASAELTK